jgi:hypothetical protein
MNLFIILLENVNISRTSANNVSLKIQRLFCWMNCIEAAKHLKRQKL